MDLGDLGRLVQLRAMQEEVVAWTGGRDGGRWGKDIGCGDFCTWLLRKGRRQGLRSGQLLGAGLGRMYSFGQAEKSRYELKSFHSLACEFPTSEVIMQLHQCGMCLCPVPLQTPPSPSHLFTARLCLKLDEPKPNPFLHWR